MRSNYRLGGCVPATHDLVGPLGLRMLFECSLRSASHNIQYALR